MKMKKILALLMALAMCLGLAACGGGDTKPEETTEPETTENGGSETASTGDALKIGFIGPLTGAAALYGTAVNNGAQIAVEEINAMGGLQIELKAMDDEHDAEKATNAYNQLQDWGVQVIVGAVTSTPCNAVAAEAFADRGFMLTPSASSPTVIEGRDNVYQLCFSDTNQGSASAQYISENNLATKIAVIYNNADAYSTGIFQNFEAAAGEYGLELVSVTTFTDDAGNDFSVQLADAQNKGAELVFLPIYYQPAALILNQAKTMDFDTLFFGCDGLDGILGLEGFDTTLAEGLMLLTPFAADAEDSMTQDFVAAYEAAYGEIPSQFAADGYDCVYALYYACQFAEVEPAGMTAAELCELMIETFSSEAFTVNGLTGAGMTWDVTGEVSKAPKAVVIEDGAYVGM